jgi:hypothetical protein
MTPNHGPLTIAERDVLMEDLDTRQQPCYSCGRARYVAQPRYWLCRWCGRVICSECWQHEHQATSRRCLVPAASPEAQAAEWAREIERGQA